MDKSRIREINRLIVGIKRGKQEALEDLFEMTRGQLYVVAKAYLYDKSKIDEVLSDTYMRIVKYADTFDVAKNGYGWIYEITKNVAYSYNRQDKCYIKEDMETVDREARDNIDSMLDGILVGIIAEKLKPHEKEILRLYYFEGYTIREIAKILDKPKSTVSDMLKRILARLREEVGV